jgi:hypothetical protein
MPAFLNKQTAAGVLAALAISAAYRWYIGTNLGI